MKLSLGLRCDKYRCESLALLFFPTASFAGAEDGLSAELRTAQEDGALVAETKLYVEGKLFCARSQAKNERDCDFAVGRSFYLAAKQATGKAPKWGILTGVRPAKIVKPDVVAGAGDAQIISRLERELFVSPEKTALALAAAKQEIEAEKALCGKTASLYLSVPFCPSRCAYCSFVSHSIEKTAKLIPEYSRLVLRELEAAMRAADRKKIAITSVYVGGGTPTALPEAELKAVLGALDACGAGEFTVEAGRPDTVTERKLEIIKRAGADRICINPQTVHDKTLEKIGRRHTAEQFFRAYELARACGFRHVNCDLIAGLPDESQAEFGQSVDAMISLGADNVTVHALSIKKSADFVSGAAGLLERGERISGMTSLAAKKLANAGYAPYYLYRQKRSLDNGENVGYQKSGSQCLYNVYMMGDIQSIISVGAGASSKAIGEKICRIYNPKYPYEYIERIEDIIARKTRFIDEML